MPDLTRKPWNMREVAVLRRHYGPRAPEPLPAADVARALGRTLKSVQRYAFRLGLARAYRSIDPDHLRSLHARGMTDGEMGAEVGRSKYTVRKTRVRLGLPCHCPPWSSVPRSAVENDCASLTDLRHLVERLRAARRWPRCDVAAGEAAVLDALACVQAATARALADLVGRQKVTVQHHLARLVARGLVRVAGSLPTRTTRAPAYALAGQAARVARERGMP